LLKLCAPTAIKHLADRVAGLPEYRRTPVSGRSATSLGLITDCRVELISLARELALLAGSARFGARESCSRASTSTRTADMSINLD
jgi:hypothetical protein